MPQIVSKLVEIKLVGLDGNAFNLIGQWQRAARKQGIPKTEIDAVIKACTEGDYDRLLCVLMDNSTDENKEDDGKEAS